MDWLAVSNFLSAPAKGKTIYETAPKSDTKNAIMISGGILAVGLLAVFILSKK